MIKVVISLFCLSLIHVNVESSAAWASRTRSEVVDTSGAGRGFVGFINQQELTWEEFRVQGVASGLKAKTLSRDPQTGAVSLLISYPPGWRSRADSNYHSGDEEIFVLEGDLTIGVRTLTDRCYSFIPAGMAHGPVSSRNGCLALTFFDREPDVIASNESKPGAKIDRVVEYKNYFDEPWALGATRAKSKTPPPLLVKVLRQDGRTGARTWIAGVLSGHPNYTWETHPTWEEGYLIEGEYRLAECLDRKSKAGVYTPGSYFFRPAGLPHVGPDAGAKGYAIWLFRMPAELDVKYLDKTACK
jgi:quercetin dioxygenase-like cupin family protein